MGRSGLRLQKTTCPSWPHLSQVSELSHRVASLSANVEIVSRGTLSKHCSASNALCHDLLFREPGPSSLVEDELDKYETEVEVDETLEDDEDKGEGWEALYLDDDEDDEESDIEIDRP